MKWTFLLISCFLVACEGPFDSDSTTKPTEVFQSFWEEVDRNYSFFTYTDLDWDSVKMVYRPLISSTTTDQELLEVFDDMLDVLNDPHTLVYAPTGIAGPTNYFDAFPTNEIDDITPYFTNYQVINSAYDVGYFEDENLTYLRIKTFDAEAEMYEPIDSLWNIISNHLGVIIDVRSNRGGLISNAERVLSHLTASARTTCWYRFRNGENHTNFSNWEAFQIAPNDESANNPFRIMLLTNRQSFSACEWFVLSAATFSNVTTVGDTTGGGSGRPIMRELANGWILQVSNSQMKLISGRDFQFIGLYPDIPVGISDEDAASNTDTILDAAIQQLSN